MRIAMVSCHACIRLHKMALPLIDRGHEVHLIAKKQPAFANYYKSFLHYSHIDQCIESIRLIEPHVDVFHVHNEPSWYSMAIKEITDKPVIMDVHDSFLSRSTQEEATQALDQGLPHVRVTAEERAAFQVADGLNFCSEPLREMVVGEFKLKQPTMTLPSYVPQSLYRYHLKEWMGGLVYEGRVTVASEHKGRRGGTGADYCDYSECAKQARALGMDFHLYAGRDDEAFRQVYDENAVVHPGYPYDRLLDQVSRHDWGLVGNTIDTRQWRIAEPNKLYEYMACAVPVVAINAQHSAKIINDHGVGIVVKSLEELARRWKEHEQARIHVIKKRKQFAMERHIHQLEAFYERFV